MKKTGFFTLFFIFLCAGVWGTDYTWTGGAVGNDNWEDPANWEESVSHATVLDFPGKNSGDTAIINISAAVTLTDDVPNTLVSLEIDGANLDLGGFSLTAGILNFISGNLNIDNNTLTVTGTLTQSAGTIELSDGAIEAGNIIQSGGTINITNAGTLKSGGTVTQHGIITGGVITFEADDDIDIQGSITGDQLIAITGGDVIVGTGGIINVTGNGDHATSPDGKGAAIYIEANDFNPADPLSVTPGTGELCLKLGVAYPKDYFDAYVDGVCYIYNTITTLKNLVYYNSSHTLLSVIQSLFPSSDYDYTDSSDSSNLYNVGYNKEIVIYYIGSNKDVTFTIGGVTPTGSITIYGDYSASNLTLNPGTGGIKFVDAEITVGGFNTAAPLTLDGTDNSINAANISLNTVNGGGNLFTLTGNVIFNGVVNITAELFVDGTAAINADITVGGDQTYNGTVTLAGAVTRVLTSGNGAITAIGNVTAPNGIIVSAHGNIAIGGGIAAGTVNEVIRLESGANININGSITCYQLIAIAVGNVNIGAAAIITVTSGEDHDSYPGDGKGAAIYIKAYDFFPANTAPITLVTSSGVMCLELTAPHPQDYFDSFVVGVCHVHNTASVKSLVYYNRNVTSDTDIQIIFNPANYYFIDVSDLSDNYTVNPDNEIIIYCIGDNKDVTFTVSGPDPTGSITIYGEYSADNLILNPGTGGVLLKDAKVEIKNGDFIMTADIFVLGITAESGIKAVNITLSNVAAAGKNLTLEASGVVSIGQINADVVSFGGGLDTAPLEISVSGELGNAKIMRGSNVKNAGDIVQADGKTLELEENTVLDTSAGSWRIGNGTPVQNSFTGYYGALKLGENSNLITNNFNLFGASPDTFTVNNSGWAAVSVSGDEVNIGNSVNLRPSGTDYAKFIIKMDGNGDQTITTAQILGSLHIGLNSYTQLKSHLGLSGQMLIKNTSSTQGVLDAGSYNITLYAEISGGQKDGYQNPVIGRWEIDGADETISTNAPVYSYPMNGAFRQKPGGFVEFKKGALDGNVFFEILGNTVWQKFICREAGAVIQFSMHPDQHVFLDTFDVKGASDNHITLTRYIDPNDAAKAGWSIIYDTAKVPDGAVDGALIDPGLPSVPVMRDLKNEGAPYTELSKFWNFNVISTGAKNPLDVDNITVYFSHAWNQKAPISSAGINVIPFYKEAGVNRKGYFNYDWGSEGRAIIYSYTEDGNGNGKVDRIRVQTNVRLNADFRNFTVEVEGYKVDTARGQSAANFGVLAPNGFDLVSRITGDETDDGSFYIYLEEHDALYDGKPIVWRVTQNGSLTDISRMQYAGTRDSGEVYKTTNTIPPRVSYALTMPGHPQTFVQMSQPVSAYDGALSINGNRRSGTQNYTVIDRTPSGQFALEYNAPDEPPKQYIVNIPEGSLNYLLELDSSPTAASLAALPQIGINAPDEYFTLDGLKDLNVRALDWNDPKVDDDSYLLYPPPRYPVDWNYSGYADYSGNGHVQGLSVDASNNAASVFLPPFEVLTPEMMRRLETYATDISSGKIPSVLPVTPGDFVNPNIENKKRRSTDALVSISPQEGSSLNYFAWPVWARYDVVSSGVVWDFDGTKYLEDSDKNDISVQVKLFNINELNALGFYGLSLFYGFEVPAEWRNPPAAAERGRSTGGLWLPGNMSNNINPLFNIVPDKTLDIATGRVGFYSAKNSPVTAAGQLFTFNIPSGDFSNGGKIEFVLRLEGNSNGDPYMFIARLDAPPGVIPGDWYAHIRAFSFDITNTRQQRGGVTILNNVINSDKKEITYIRYNLPRSGRVTVQIYTLDGTLIKSLRRNEYREAGTYVDTWDGSNNGGRAVARGMYFVRVVGPDIDEIRKIMVVK